MDEATAAHSLSPSEEEPVDGHAANVARVGAGHECGRLVHLKCISQEDIKAHLHIAVDATRARAINHKQVHPLKYCKLKVLFPPFLRSFQTHLADI